MEPKTIAQLAKENKIWAIKYLIRGKFEDIAEEEFNQEINGKKMVDFLRDNGHDMFIQEIEFRKAKVSHLHTYLY